MLYMLALVGQPSLRGRDACMVSRVRGHPGEIAGSIYVRPLFSLLLLFLLSRISVFFYGVECFFGLRWMLRLIFLAVVEHRLIPTRVRSEWARLRCKRLASIWAPASQDASHVGHAGVGVVSMRGAPLSLPSSATVQFQRFFDCGRAVRCVLPGWR